MPKASLITPVFSALHVLRLTPTPFLISAFLLVFAIVDTSYAQSIISDGTMGTNVQLDNGNYVISEGTSSGTNLFHSFGKFNVDTNESATFTGPNSIHNIIGRVTGGTQSWIDGLLRSTIDGANLFLLNPAGVLFGPNSRLDLNGSFHVSTADYLGFENGDRLYVNPSKNSLLSVSSPSAFGFLSGNPASISTQGVLGVPEGETLSLIGGDIQVTGSGIQGVEELGAPGGRINIASVASPGEVIPNPTGESPDLIVDSFQELGAVSVSQNALINAGGAGGGTIIIRGGRLLVENAFILASSKAHLTNGTPGAGIDIKVSEDVVLDVSIEGASTQIGTNVFDGVPDDSGGVRIGAHRLEVRNGAQILSAAYAAWDSNPASIGNTGNIEVTSNSLLVCDGGQIRTGTGGYGDSGDIIVKTGSLELRDGGIIYSPVFGGSGNGGDVDVTADSVMISNAKYPGYLTGIKTKTEDPATGKAGDVRLTANSLDMSAGTQISSSSEGVGQGGNLDIEVNGDVSIQGTMDLTPSDNNIYTGIFADTSGSGDCGGISVAADSLELNTKAYIQSSIYYGGSGDAGDVKIRVGSMELKDGSYICSNALWSGGGNSGSLDIEADSVLMSGPESSSDPFDADFTGLSTTTGEWGGQGGYINVTTNSMTMDNRSQISAASFGSKPSGNIEIDADSLHILAGSNIIASAFGTGDGGTVSLTADTLCIAGVHAEPFTNILGYQSLAISGVASQTGIGGGNAGDVWISAETLEVLDGGRIGAETFGAGDAGEINIESDNVLVSGVNAGALAFQIEADKPFESAHSAILASTYPEVHCDDPGKGGSIHVSAERLEVLYGGRVASETSTPGLGGDIEVTANQVMLFNDGEISAKSKGSGDAGNIYISAADSFLMTDSAVTTEASQADGGNIKVDTEYMVDLRDSEITASVGGGPETIGGNISIDPEYVILNNSKIIANAYEGRGGNISIFADVYLADPASIVDASSALGIDGQVDIRAPINQVSGIRNPLPKDFRSALALLREPCMVRLQGGKYSSFVIKGRDGLPLEPGGFLPSPIF